PMARVIAIRCSCEPVATLSGNEIQQEPRAGDLRRMRARLVRILLHADIDHIQILPGTVPSFEDMHSVDLHGLIVGRRAMYGCRHRAPAGASTDVGTGRLQAS